MLPGAITALHETLRRPRWTWSLCGGVLLLAGVSLGARDLWMTGKALLAERLIARAFERRLAGDLAARPWPHADVCPIARIEVPRLGVVRHVLCGGSGTSMAFGPGHLDGTARPGEGGNAVLVGHRDSWMRFLEEIELGDEIRVTIRAAQGPHHKSYEVVRLNVVAEDDAGILLPTSHAQIRLVTCYPFHGLLRTPWRYVVTAREAHGRTEESGHRESNRLCSPGDRDSPNGAATEGFEAWRGRSSAVGVGPS